MNLISIRSTPLSPIDLDFMQNDIFCIHIKYFSYRGNYTNMISLWCLHAAGRLSHTNMSQ